MEQVTEPQAGGAVQAMAAVATAALTRVTELVRAGDPNLAGAGRGAALALEILALNPKSN